MGKSITQEIKTNIVSLNYETVCMLSDFIMDAFRIVDNTQSMSFHINFKIGEISMTLDNYKEFRESIYGQQVDVINMVLSNYMNKIYVHVNPFTYNDNIGIDKQVSIKISCEAVSTLKTMSTYIEHRLKGDGLHRGLKTCQGVHLQEGDSSQLLISTIEEANIGSGFKEIDRESTDRNEDDDQRVIDNSKVAYKYRSNSSFGKNGKKLDTESLLANKFYAASFKSLNDPFEASAELPPENIKGNEWVIGVKQAIYSAGVYSLIKQKKGEDFPANELMWSHYANSHQGFCIEYDLDVLKKNLAPQFDMRSLIDVIYQDNRPEITDADSLDAIHKKAFGTKSLAWKDENEVRLIFITQGLKPILKGAIKAIYFGLNMSAEDRNDIIKGFLGENVDLYQIERVGNTYRLQATKLMFKEDYEVINIEQRKTVDNYMILYKSSNKDRNTIKEFVDKFRSNLSKPSNLTIIDDLRVVGIIDKSRSQMTLDEIKIMAKHWIAYSTFDAPSAVWMYPEKM